ncbi:hypothetical protein B0T25DRAFT_537291 [Lasiosphaeria hispida]|uniref:Uncharacterized protein n=1 Tax=Lasiosphaeria hispida TaxID=260671 RepID=A0AAJ0HKT4_9PEZI|nr:hypothetical protein B0T25DRAFT_537291 [Lasiosphaeria hispida]
MAPPKPRFLLLDQPLPSSALPSLLGRFVHDYNSPLDRSAPSTLPSFVASYIHQHGDQTSASLAISTSQSSTVRAKLEHLLSLSRGQNASQQHDITTSRIRTCRLHDHDRVFDLLMSDPTVRREVDGLFRRPGARTRTVYMVVGVKTFLNAAMRSERGRGGGSRAEATVPIGKVLGAVGVGAAADASVGGEWSREGQTNLALDATYENEQIFAVEYRVVSIGLFQALWKSGSGPRLGGARNFDWGDGVMGHSEDEGEDDDEAEGGQRLPALQSGKVEGAGGVLWVHE